MYVATGEFARSDRATENKRFYPHALWEREIQRLSKQIEGRKVYGELDHPMDGRTQLKRASHIITDLHLEGSKVIGTAYIMDTDAGRNLKAIMDAQGAVGVSSRGFGTTKPNLKGEDVVQEDYRLMTFDFVAEPAMSSAYPKITKEDKDAAHPVVTEASMEENITLKELQEKHPKLYEFFMNDAEREQELRLAKIWEKKIMGAKEEASTDLRAEFAEKLEAVLANARKEIEDSVRERLMNDPAIGGSKKALDEVKLLLRPLLINEDVDAVVGEVEKKNDALQQDIVEKNLEIVNLLTENDKLAEIAREAGYRFHLEERLHQISTHAELVRGLIGDVTRFKNLEELDLRFDAIVEEVKSQEAVESASQAEIVKLQEEVATHKLIADKSMSAMKELATQVYTEQRLANHPNPELARQLVESSGPRTKEGVDSILETIRHQPRQVRNEDLDAARARVRKMVNSSSLEYLQESHEKPASDRNLTENYNGVGQSAEEILSLSGLPDGNPNSN